MLSLPNQARVFLCTAPVGAEILTPAARLVRRLWLDAQPFDAVEHLGGSG